MVENLSFGMKRLDIHCQILYKESLPPLDINLSPWLPSFLQATMRLFFVLEILGAEQCPKGLWATGILELRGGKEKCQERK